MSAEHEQEQSMKLPEGFTCDDCRLFGYCTKLIGNVSGNTECDWAPSRFRAKELAARGRTGELN